MRSPFAACDEAHARRLARLHALSGGATQEANEQLVWSNVRLTARVAGAL
jgi:pseudouridine-5'-phosphate glycosidase